MINLKLGNTIYTGFIKASVKKDVEDFFGTISFEATVLQGGNFPVQRGIACSAFIDEVQVLNGYIDDIEASGDAKTHKITVKGRDKTMDVMDSNTGPEIELRTPISLVDVIKAVLRFLNITDIQVIDNVGNIPPFQPYEMVSAILGRGAFDFMQDYAIMRGVLLTTDGNGNIVITRASGTQTTASLLNEIGGLSNNILTWNVRYDDSKRFYRYLVLGQGNTAAISLAALEDDNPQAPTPASNVTIKGEQFDETVRKSRTLVINADKASNISDTVNRAQWERDVRRARAINYTCTVSGHRQFGFTGDVWQPLQIVRVIDDDANVNDDLIIRSVEWTVSADGVGETGGSNGGSSGAGSFTKLDLVPKDAFLLLSAEERRKQKKRKKGGAGLADQATINKVLFGLDS